MAPPPNGPERRCKAADQLQHDDSRNARHLLFTLHWLRIRVPFKGSCFHLQEARAQSATFRRALRRRLAAAKHPASVGTAG